MNLDLRGLRSDPASDLARCLAACEEIRRPTWRMLRACEEIRRPTRRSPACEEIRSPTWRRSPRLAKRSGVRPGAWSRGLRRDPASDLAPWYGPPLAKRSGVRSGSPGTVRLCERDPASDMGPMVPSRPESAREPMFNLPAVVLLAILVLFGIHAVREWVLSGVGQPRGPARGRPRAGPLDGVLWRPIRGDDHRGLSDSPDENLRALQLELARYVLSEEAANPGPVSATRSSMGPGATWR